MRKLAFLVQLDGCYNVMDLHKLIPNRKMTSPNIDTARLFGLIKSKAAFKMEPKP